MTPKMFGRQFELNRIIEIVQKDPTSSFICVHGPGGIGKTTLLQATCAHFEGDAEVRITDILNFDDLQLHVAQYIPYVIAEQLSPPNMEAIFPNYLQAYNRLQVMQQQTKVTAYQVQEQAQQTEEAFLEDYRQLASQQRLVILLDTVEKIQHATLWPRTIALLSQLPNTVLVLAGRESAQIHDDLQKTQSHPPIVTHLLELNALPFEIAEAYFKRTPLGENIARNSPELVQRICKLTRRPILLDLAIDWLREGMPLPELEQPEGDLDEATIQALQPKFEQALVQTMFNLADPIHEVILYMAHVYHFFDSEILQHLTGHSEEECAELLTDIQEFSFIKPRPGGGMTLHDEMQRLVVAYVWPRADMSGRMRRDISAKMIDYFEGQLPKYPPNSVIWQAIVAEQLHHHLYVDLDKGYEKFNALFQNAEDWHQTDFCLMLLDFLQPFKAEFSAQQNAWLSVKRGWLAIQLNDIDAALRLINQGRVQLVELGETQDMDEIYNSLGYCHRLLGNWEQAIANYEEALALSRQERDAKQIAETMNNLANVCRFNGDFERSLRYSKLSLLIREKLGDKMAIASSSYVRGMILWEIGNTAEAAAYLSRAQELYRALENPVRMAWVDYYIGYFHYLLRDIEIATQYLERAEAAFRTHNAKGNLSETLNTLSRLSRNYKTLDTPEESEQYAQEALEAAEAVGDDFKISQACLTFCVLYTRWGTQYWEQADQLAQEGRSEEAQALKRKGNELYGKSQAYFERGFPIAEKGHYTSLLMRYHRSFANRVYNEQQWQRAFEHYIEEGRLSANHKFMRFDRALDKIARQLMDLPTPALTRQYCDYVISEWTHRGLHYRFPEMITECERVKAFLTTPDEAASQQAAQTQRDLTDMGKWHEIKAFSQQTLEQSRIYPANLYTVRTLNHRAFALRQLGDFAEARRLCTQSLHIAQSLEDDQAIAESYYTIGTIQWIIGNTQEAAISFRNARRIFQELDNEIWLAKVRRFEGFLYFRIGNLEKSIDLLEEACAIFEAQACLADLADVLKEKSRVLLDLKKQKEAEQKQEEAEQKQKEAEKAIIHANTIARKIGNAYITAETLIGLYMLNSQKANQAEVEGDLQEVARYSAIADRCLKEGSDIAHERGYNLLISVYEEIFGNLAFDENKWGQAFAHYVKALETGANFEYARLHRTLDPCITRLIQLRSEDLIRYYADYMIHEWKSRGLDTTFPDVVTTLELIKEYQEYVI